MRDTDPEIRDVPGNTRRLATLLVGRKEGHPACKKTMGGWWRWALVSPAGVAPSRMVGVSASVNLPLHHKVQKFSSGTGLPGSSQKKGHKTGVCVCWRVVTLYSATLSNTKSVHCPFDVFDKVERAVYCIEGGLCNGTWMWASIEGLTIAVSLLAALRAAQTCRYLIYSEADFEVFRPTEATRCTDGGEIWHGGGD